MLTLFRGLAHRAGSTLAIFVVALLAVAAASAGPIYNSAARSAVLSQTFAGAPPVQRSIESTYFGDTSSLLPDLQKTIDDELARETGSEATVNRIFGPGISSLELTSIVPSAGAALSVVARTGACGDLTIEKGHCPTAAGQVMVSRPFVNATHITLGAKLAAKQVGTLHVVGIYATPNPLSPVWYDRGSLYFPQESPCITLPCPPKPSDFDTLFTPFSTLNGTSEQGTATYVRPVDSGQITPADADTLETVGNKIQVAFDIVNVQTGIPETVAVVRASWSSLATSILVVTGEMLVLVWMLLFLVVTDFVEARGGELALARLRGAGRWRSLRFALSPPMVILLVALPIGTIIGWAGAALLAGTQLPSGTEVPLPALAWGTAALATIGGLAAVVVAARATLSRSVVEQWRRTTREATRRGWVLDAIVATAALLGIVQLIAGGAIGATHRSPITLLVPGLLGISVAIIGSRLLPLMARTRFDATRNGGGLGPFLAFRHIGRRPAGTRTTIILATAAALATFSIASWSISSMNRSHAADLTVGASTVFSVSTDPGVDVAKVVDRIDPGGRNVTVVERASSQGPVTLAVQPSRFAAVAHWDAAGIGNAESLLRALTPSSPAPIVLTGSAVRVGVTVKHLDPDGSSLSLDYITSGSTAPTAVPLGTLHRGSSTHTGGISGCPCQLVDLQVTAPPVPGSSSGAVTGTIALTDLAEQSSGQWHPVPGGTAAGHWSPAQGQGTVSSQASGLSWQFASPAGGAGILNVNDHPNPLPAVAASALSDQTLSGGVTGLDGRSVDVNVVHSVAAVPGAPENGVVVDQTYAQRAALGVVTAAIPQVWVDHDAGAVREELTRNGVQVQAVSSSGDLAQRYSQQGPGLASVVFVADAVTAAILAALAAIFSLAIAARRRRYEYAALSTAGLTQPQLFSALAIEQVAVVGFGVIVGIVTGLVATGLVARDVPEFITRPAAVTLHYTPSIPLLIVTLGGGTLLLMGVAVFAAWRLLRSIGPERLRAGPG